MRKIVLISTISVILCLLGSNSIAQISIDRFLISAEKEVALKAIDEQERYLASKPYALNIINRLQFRLQNNEGLNKDTQRFGFWLSPSNPWAISSTNNYYKAYNQSLGYERSIVIRRAFVERYHLVLDFVYMVAIKSLADREKQLLDAQISIMQNQQVSDYFKPSDFADMKLRQVEKDVEIEEAAYDVLAQQNMIEGKMAGETVSHLGWTRDSLISVDAIIRTMDTLNAQGGSIDLKNAEAKIKIAEQAYNIQKSNINTGFIQSNYTPGNASKENKNPWGMVAGITIPIANPNKGDMARKQLQVIQATNDRDQKELQINLQRKSLRTKLNSLTARYQQTIEKRSTINIASLGSILSAMQENNPIVVVRLQTAAIKLDRLIVKLEHDVQTTYIDLLAAMDLLQQRPYVNFLSQELRSLER